MAIYNISVKDGHLAKYYSSFGGGYNYLARSIAPPCGCCEGTAKTFAVSWDIDYSNAPCVSDFVALSGSDVATRSEGPGQGGYCVFSTPVPHDIYYVRIQYTPGRGDWTVVVEGIEQRTSGVCDQHWASDRAMIAWLAIGKLAIPDFQCDGVNVFNIYTGGYFCLGFNTLGQPVCKRFGIAPAAGTVIVAGL